MFDNWRYNLKESDFTYKLDRLIFISNHFFIIIPITKYFVYIYIYKMNFNHIKYTILQKQILNIMSTYIQNKKNMNYYKFSDFFKSL